MSMSSSSMVSNDNNNPPPPAGYGGDGSAEGEAAAPVTSCLYLRPGAGALDRDAVLRRLRHRRRHNHLRDTLHAMVQSPAKPQPADAMDGGAERHLPWPLDDAFSAP